MSDLLKEAIADAKAVRETALQNAKMALEEAFTPHLKSMLSAKLAEDEFEEDDEEMGEPEDEMGEPEDEMGEPEEEFGEPEEVPVDIGDEEEFGEPEEPEMEEEGIIEIDGVKYAPLVSEDDEEDGNPFDQDAETEELDLEAVIRELEQEIAEADEADEDKVDVDGEETVTEQDDDGDDDDDDAVKTEQSTSSGIGKGTGVKAASAGDEEDPGKGKVHEQVETLQSELNEYKEAIKYLRDKLHEVNILNAKLLYTNRLFREFALSNNQKLKIVETFDRAQTTREIKLVYSTLAESYKETGSVKKTEIKEFASRKSGTTAPKRKIITEEDQVAKRFQKLAGILND